MSRKKNAPVNPLLRHGLPPDLSLRDLPERRELSIGAKMKRRLFISAYVRNFNATEAYYATGYEGNPKQAAIKGRKMLTEPYVQALLTSYLDALEEDEIVSRKEILAGLKREANHFGEDATHSARVTAWSKLAATKGMGTEGKNGGNSVAVMTTGNVMVVPMAQSQDEWEAMARTQQAQLKQQVKQISRDVPSDGT